MAGDDDEVDVVGHEASRRGRGPGILDVVTDEAEVEERSADVKKTRWRTVPRCVT